jgi:hypothetical protein
LPCFFFALVELLEELVVDVEPEASEAELVVVDDSSVFTFRPLSLVEVLLVDSDSVACEDCTGACAIMAAAVKRPAMNIFIAYKGAGQRPV